MLSNGRRDAEPILERSAQRIFKAADQILESQDGRTSRIGGAVVKAAIYARVSTFDQEPENQLQELRRYTEARGWTAVEYVDRGVSGSKDRRPPLDQLLADAKRRKFDVLVCWRLDRLGRNLKHLITLLEDLQALGIAFVSLAEGIDATTPAGRLQMQILGAIAEFERERIRADNAPGLRANGLDDRRQSCRFTASRTSPDCRWRKPLPHLEYRHRPSNAGVGGSLFLPSRTQSLRFQAWGPRRARTEGLVACTD
jgi:hypothetical protein